MLCCACDFVPPSSVTVARRSCGARTLCPSSTWTVRCDSSTVPERHRIKPTSYLSERSHCMGFHSFWVLRESASTAKFREGQVKSCISISICSSSAPHPPQIPQSPVFCALVLRMKSEAQGTVDKDASVLACSGGRSVYYPSPPLRWVRESSCFFAAFHCCTVCVCVCVSVAASGLFSQISFPPPRPASLSSRCLFCLTPGGVRPGSRIIINAFFSQESTHVIDNQHTGSVTNDRV